MKLAQLQQSFQSHILAGDEAIAGQISVDARFPSALRLGVYTQGYATRLVEVLAETFPAVQAALGADLFARCISDFVKLYPSRFRSARAYGAELSQWLASRLTGRRAAGLADLARFEWAVAGAFDAADASVLKPDSLAALKPGQWPRLTFSFAPSLRRLTVRSNCVGWWKFACAAEPKPGCWRSTSIQEWLIWRQELAVFYRRLSRSETHVLDAAIAGRSFAELCEALSGPAAAVTLLRGWFDAGLIVGAHSDPALS